MPPALPGKPAPAPALRLAVVVASLGRPETLAELLDELRQQSQPPEQIILSVTCEADLPPQSAIGADITVLIGPKGSCTQRNLGIAHISDDCDIVLFCDDDYVPSRYMTERLRAFFAANPDVAGASGRLLADGIHGPGVSANLAGCIVSAYDSGPAPALTPRKDRYGLYGCNMAFRTAAIGGVRFDERLPLYGWQEDIDFSAQISRYGRIVSTHAFAGVHRGVKAGRSSGVRVGYSQVVNPVYLCRKGTMRKKYAARIILRNVGTNLCRIVNPEPWVDRWGRVRGNWIGLLDLACGRITPERIVQL
ncbi:MAG: glycosyltransferase family 2 protein [Sphingobium sp.]|nr:glycosyltransferase family 2 protein [Sphingobium sp.]MBP6112346.1 glycosyltransferase family 2 protein [Sphingobium sp.]MBP8670500.1 glycosyltransferase family 2 protein [Sphingobium sp.]MBP9157303.1 glycosyltransferase family 2 protein [Sphingobium sp.]MCC6482548.1 glycosyltransferase family 2 protein [Sphingomonadaceae bacterium]